jgi:hypothetical protein
VGLSILALPLFLCGLVTGGFLASVVAASVAMLWLAPSRHWFAGTTPPVATPSTRAADPGTGLPPLPPPPHVTHDVTQGPPPWPTYPSAQQWLAPPPPQPVRRPTALTAACAITWICCALTVFLAVLLVAVLVTDAEGLFAEMHRQNPDLADQGVSDATLRTATWVTAVVCLVWAVASSALALMAFLRKRWAAIGLVVSAAGVALFCLAGSLVSPPLALPGVLAAATVGLLLQPSVQRWLSRRESRGAPPGPGGGSRVM